MAENQSFWKGIAAGFFAGLTVAAALRYSPIERFITNLSTVEGKVDKKLAALEEKLNDGEEDRPTTAFHSRRDQPESAGDPRDLTSARAESAAEFIRTGGAPHGRSEAETLEIPGRPGELQDASQPIRSHSRTVDLGGRR